MRQFSLLRSMQYVLSGVCGLLFVFALPNYAGSIWVYTVFSLLSAGLLYSAFRKNALFFDTFIGIFLWLGFWLKLTIRVAFSNGVFGEAVGHFDGSGEAFDRALLVASCGLFGLLAASFLREKLWFKYSSEVAIADHSGLSMLYRRYRKPLLVLFLFSFVAIGISNAYLGIYQKGTVTQTTLPWGLNGVFKWLLLFGFATVSALFIRFEMSNPKPCWPWLVILGLFECFVSNVSQLSRGMILNGSALMYGALLTAWKAKIDLHWRLIGGVLAAFLVMFAASVLSINYFRAHQFNDVAFEATTIAQPSENKVEVGVAAQSPQQESRAKLDVMAETQQQTQKLFIDRWVGMEGVMAVSSYPDLGWEIWKAAWQEAYNEKDTSLYDNRFIHSSYAATDKSRHHFISLPGVIAFFFYPGSFAFLIFCMFTLGLFAAFVEIATFKFGGGNLILCALIAQVVAYRYASFGYVPQQSYLLFGTIFANLLILYLLNKLFSRALTSV